MKKPRNRPRGLLILFVAVSVTAAVLTAIALPYLSRRSHQAQRATAKLDSLWMQADSVSGEHQAETVTPQTVQHLLDQGADVDGGAQDGLTPLLGFSEVRNMDVVKLLLTRGATLREPVRWGYRGRLVRYKVDPEYAGQIMCNCLSRADIVQMLLDKDAEVNSRDWTGTSALSLATLDGDFDTVKLLVLRGADVNAGHHVFGPPLVSLTWFGKADLVQLCLDHGANPNVTDEGGNTPLNNAVWVGNTAIVQSLLSHGAKVNSEYVDEQSMLDIARRRGNIEMVKLLKAAGAR